jgi:hypothetical protein
LISINDSKNHDPRSSILIVIGICGGSQFLEMARNTRQTTGNLILEVQSFSSSFFTAMACWNNTDEADPQGSAWSYDERSEEYYIHLFASEQPDLN